MVTACANSDEIARDLGREAGADQVADPVVEPLAGRQQIPHLGAVLSNNGAWSGGCCWEDRDLDGATMANDDSSRTDLDAGRQL